MSAWLNPSLRFLFRTFASSVHALDSDDPLCHDRP
jgi:hypothetical protein